MGFPTFGRAVAAEGAPLPASRRPALATAPCPDEVRAPGERRTQSSPTPPTSSSSDALSPEKRDSTSCFPVLPTSYFA